MSSEFMMMNYIIQYICFGINVHVQVQNQKCYEIQIKVKISKQVIIIQCATASVCFVFDFLLIFCEEEEARLGEMEEEKPMKRRRHILLDAAINIVYFQGFILAIHAAGL